MLDICSKRNVSLHLNFTSGLQCFNLFLIWLETIIDFLSNLLKLVVVAHGQKADLARNLVVGLG